MGETSKTELSKKEILKILRNAAKKKVVIDESPPIVPLEIIKENIRKKGEVWKKEDDEEEKNY